MNRKILAWGVHLFTATGALWGLLALMAIFRHEWRAAIAWMILAMFVDGFDGMLARWADVKTYAAGLDGALLDNILDYINYVLVPALFLVEADFILPVQFRMAGAFALLLTSAYQFTQSDAKTDDHYFKGFPSYWNVMVLYMLVIGLDPWVNLFFLVRCPSTFTALLRPMVRLEFCRSFASKSELARVRKTSGSVHWPAAMR